MIGFTGTELLINLDENDLINYPFTEEDLILFNKIFNENIFENTKTFSYKRSLQKTKKSPLKQINLVSIHGGGESKKIRNLNWKNILKISLESLLGEATIIETKIVESIFSKGMLTFTFLLYILIELNQMTKIKISKEDGLILWIISTLTFYRSFEVTGDSTIENISKYFYKFQEEYNLIKYTNDDILQRLNYLEELKCIEKKDNKWETVEFVKINEK